jgi:hypothetical protein
MRRDRGQQREMGLGLIHPSVHLGKLPGTTCLSRLVKGSYSVRTFGAGLETHGPKTRAEGYLSLQPVFMAKSIIDSYRSALRSFNLADYSRCQLMIHLLSMSSSLANPLCILIHYCHPYIDIIIQGLPFVDVMTCERACGEFTHISGPFSRDGKSLEYVNSLMMRNQAVSRSGMN